MRITNGSVGLNVTIDGRPDAPPAVLLHGIISSGRTWNWLVPTLAETHRVIRLDFRGHGESDRAVGAYDLPDYLSDAVAVCEQVAGTPALVIGHSLGGLTGLALAQTRPDLVAAAVLEDPPLTMPGGNPTDEEAAPNALLEGFRLMRQSIPMMQATGMSAADLTAMMTVMPNASGRTFGDDLHPDGITTMAEGMLMVDATVLDMVLTGARTLVFAMDQPLDVPVTVVAADPAMPDAVTQPADLATVTATNPAVSTHTMTGAGHLIHDSFAARQKFTGIITDVIASLNS